MYALAHIIPNLLLRARREALVVEEDAARAVEPARLQDRMGRASLLAKIAVFGAVVHNRLARGCKLRVHEKRDEYYKGAILQDRH